MAGTINVKKLELLREPENVRILEGATRTPE
jgi:hypothetical protein